MVETTSALGAWLAGLPGWLQPWWPDLAAFLRARLKDDEASSRWLDEVAWPTVSVDRRD